MARGATNSLVNDLRSELNKAAKETIAYDLHGENPTDVKTWIPTGSTLLDYIISNRTKRWNSSRQTHNDCWRICQR